MRARGLAALSLFALVGASACTPVTPTATPTVAPDSGVEESVADRFSVGPGAAVVAETFAGNIDVLAGPASEVRVEVTKIAYGPTAERARSELANIAVRLLQDQGIVRVSATRAASLLPTSVANLRLYVPARTSLDLTDFAGNVTIGDTIESALSVRLISGNVLFRGSLAPGTHSVRVTSGNVELALPKDSSFTVDASVNAGSVTTDFMLSRTEKATETALKGTVGSAPNIDLTVSLTAGNIRLLQGPASATPTPSPMTGLTPEQAALMLRTTMTGARPLLIANAIPTDWRADVRASADAFTVSYRSPDASKTLTLSIALANLPIPGAATTQAHPNFHGDAAALYQVADSGNPVSERWLVWTEQRSWSQPGPAGVPYLLRTIGLTDAEFWQYAQSLHPNQIAAP